MIFHFPALSNWLGTLEAKNLDAVIFKRNKTAYKISVIFGACCLHNLTV